MCSVVARSEVARYENDISLWPRYSSGMQLTYATSCENHGNEVVRLTFFEELLDCVVVSGLASRQTSLRSWYYCL